jgi:hypothetical protein
MRDEIRNFVTPLAQWRQMDREDIEPIKGSSRISPRLTASRMRTLVAATIRKSTRTQRVPPALDLAFLQHAQQLGLRGGRECPHLVQERRAPGCALEATGAALHDAAETAMLVAEEFGLDQVLGNPRQPANTACRHRPRRSRPSRRGPDTRRCADCARIPGRRSWCRPPTGGFSLHGFRQSSGRRWRRVRCWHPNALASNGTRTRTWTPSLFPRPKRPPTASQQLVA